MVGPKKQDFWSRINTLKGKKIKQFHQWMMVRQKLGIILENKVVHKKMSLKLIFINDFLIKTSVDFGNWKLTLKVQFWYFLTNCHSSKDLKKILWVCWFLAKNLAFYDPPCLKFHNRTDICTSLWLVIQSKKGLHKLKPACNYLNLKSCSLGNCNSDIDVLSSSILSLEPLVTPNLMAIRAP